MMHPLPFENGCRLKFRLPFMEESAYGTLESGRPRNLKKFAYKFYFKVYTFRFIRKIIFQNFPKDGKEVG